MSNLHVATRRRLTRHATAAVLMAAIFLGHIYMRHGDVDAASAKEHHALWYRDIEAGTIAARRPSSSQPEPGAAIVPEKS